MELDQLASPPEAQAEVKVNQNFAVLDALAVYANNWKTSMRLTWGYLGGRWGGNAITAGTLTLTASANNYIVVARATGAISVSTATTNWGDAANYARVYKVPCDETTVLAASVEDHRIGPGGVLGS